MVAPINNSTSGTSSTGGLKSSVVCCIVVFVVLVVERSPFRVRFRWPFAVAVDSGKYFLASVDVICGKPSNCPLSIALHSVSSVGEKRHWCKNLTVSSMEVDWWMPPA